MCRLTTGACARRRGRACAATEARSHATSPDRSKMVGTSAHPSSSGTMSSPPITDRPATPAADARGPRAWWLRLPPGRRRLLRALFAVGFILILLASVVLARFLSVENVERDADLALI